MKTPGDARASVVDDIPEKGAWKNAGVTPVAPLGNITEEHYDSLFTINVKGLLFTV
jgi:NADP-dependent 3-hydroxy acid dehydrogenase YdfG